MLRVRSPYSLTQLFHREAYAHFFPTCRRCMQAETCLVRGCGSGPERTGAGVPCGGAFQLRSELWTALAPEPGDPYHKRRRCNPWMVSMGVDCVSGGYAVAAGKADFRGLG